jgi:hypothetical protein
VLATAHSVKWAVYKSTQFVKRAENEEKTAQFMKRAIAQTGCNI